MIDSVGAQRLLPVFRPERRSEIMTSGAFEVAGLGRIRIDQNLPPLAPLELPSTARAQHVLTALAEDTEHLPEDGAQRKLDKLVQSPFVFFRGTAGLFYRDLAHTDKALPFVFCNGDVHPENFGVMPGPSGELIFGLNDYDEAHPAPFTWDLKRGLVGFALASSERGFGAGARRRVLESFLTGYTTALKRFAASHAESEHRFTIDTSPAIITRLLEKAAGRDRQRFLAKRTVGGTFRATDEIVPRSDLRSAFESALNVYRRELGALAPLPAFLKVKDVAEKLGSGTGSIGLSRYYVLVEGQGRGGEDDVLLEVKEQRGSILDPYVSRVSLDMRHSERVVHAHRMLLEGGDPLYGLTEIEGRPFIVRERSPHKKGIDLSDLDVDLMTDYAKVCGEALAQAHARAEGPEDLSFERNILRAMHRGFSKDLMRTAEQLARRVENDHAVLVSARGES